ncbi:hypothetical protein FA13DRAFT_9128 [Coprinellus micaceus]|uniref:Uncharacterized protein n=1 Tax=Coprinellus micaceus TaxID=71717 RepID=A0A4Y7TZE0_COPMI|nr:hypothetical protein FA13DRAFT_9128 [Coprinellus micaceus]
MGSGVPALSSSSKDQCQTGSVSLPPFARPVVSKSDTAGVPWQYHEASGAVLPTVESNQSGSPGGSEPGPGAWGSEVAPKLQKRASWRERRANGSSRISPVRSSSISKSILARSSMICELVAQPSRHCRCGRRYQLAPRSRFQSSIPWMFGEVGGTEWEEISSQSVPRGKGQEQE